VIYPLAVAMLSSAFCAAVLCQYLQRRRPYQLVWSLALLMSALASAAYLLALPPTSSETGFRLYYALGALLMPAWLGLGSIFLVAPRRAAEITLAALVNIGALGAGAVFAAPIDRAGLAQLNGGPGTGVLEAGAWLPITIVLNTFGVAAVVGVAIYSGLQLARRKGSRQLLLATVLIAAGDLVVGIAGSMARTGLPGLFWATMFAGWIVIFAGFVLTQPATATGSRPDNGRNSPALSPAPAERTPVA
jgi:hypothetical protein